MPVSEKPEKSNLFSSRADDGKRIVCKSEENLPEWVGWVDAWNGKEFGGGQWIVADAPIERIPVYWKKGSRAIFRFDQI